MSLSSLVRLVIIVDITLYLNHKRPSSWQASSLVPYSATPDHTLRHASCYLLGPGAKYMNKLLFTALFSI
jgi:hypothetical protein